MRLAIVHERLDVMGGAEKVVAALHEIFPDAPLYTSFVDYAKMPDVFQRMDIRTSFMQRLPASLKRRSNQLLPFYMLAFQEFDLSGYDVVLSSSYLAAKSVVTNSRTCHICYCYTPMRFAWDLYHTYINEPRSPVLTLGLRLLLHYFRIWDIATANNVDYFVAISENVRQRIRKHYRREATVLYPPVQTRRFAPRQEPDDFYLVVSRLVPYKRIDIAIEAFNRLDRRLIVIGSGRQMSALQRLAGPNIQFLGWQDDAVVAEYLSRARALIFPGEEDFGIVPVEAQAAGTPVVAYGKGGALETVLAGETGLLFREQTVGSLMEGIREFETGAFDKRRLIHNAAQFDESLFRQRIDACVAECYAAFLERRNLSEQPLLRTREERRSYFERRK